MRSRQLIGAGAALLLAVSLAACESTQDKAKKLQAQGANIGKEASITVTKPNPDVKVVGKPTLLQDQYGHAIVVELRNTSKQAQVDVPILVDESDASGKSIYRNDTPGLDPSLNHLAVIKPGETISWVNDQVQPAGTPKSAKVTVGAPEGQAPAQLPELSLGSPKVTNDVSGIEAKGSVTNKSQIQQNNLVVFGIARQGGKIVAAGRSIIKTLKAGKHFSYNVFFIGNPKGADVSVTGPPTTLTAAQAAQEAAAAAGAAQRTSAAAPPD